MNANQISVEGMKLNCLVYGKSGTGKTTFACSFPKPFVFDFDKGMLSQRGKDVEYETFSSYSNFEIKLQQVIANPAFGTVVIDSVTTLQDYMMKDLLVINKRAEPTLHEWGRLIDKLQQLFAMVTKSGKNVCVVAHEQIVQDEVTSEVWILPLIVGKKLPGQLALYFDEVYRLQVGKTKEGKPSYQSLTTADTRYTAKSRLNVLLPLEDNLTYTGIMEKVKK